MIEITPNIAIAEDALQWEFVRSSGAGGQNVNKVASAAQLRFDLTGESLPPEVRERLRSLAGKRVTADGVLILKGQRFRTQERNRQDVLERLIEMIQQAAVPPKTRRPTRPSAASKRRRLEEKRLRSQTKSLRRGTVADE